MPNFDAGHYFLTVLAPVRLDSVMIDGQSHSRRHLIREALAAMPTAERTVASRGTGRDNPFSRTTTTHFCRFIVLDDVVFNGRVSGDSLVEQLKKINPLTPQPVDRLTTPFLIFVTDFDANSGDDSEVRAYLRGLWETMGDELSGIFTHCIGFDAVATADGFFDYIKKCQIETTMPFNDYWSAPLNAPNLSLTPYIVGAVAATLALVVLAIIGFFHAPWVVVLLLFLLLLLLALYGIAFLAYRKVMTIGERPFPVSQPPAPDSRLPTILKSLYLQRAFTEFAIRVQGQDDAFLYKEFGDFLTKHKPSVTEEPTQEPGVIGA